MGDKLLKAKAWLQQFWIIWPKTLTWLSPRSAPFLHLTAALAAGIVLARFPQADWLLWGLLAVGLVAGFTVKLIRGSWVVLVVLGFGILGFLREESVDRGNPLPMERRTQFVTQITDVPQVKGRYQRAVGRVLYYRDGDSLRLSDALCQVNVDTMFKVQIGEIINYQSKTYPFDSVYNFYYTNQGVFGKQYIYDLDSLDRDLTAAMRLKIFRENIAQRIRGASPDTQSTAIMSALTVGMRGDLSYRTRAAYRAAGASHLLAISGLHVGIVCALIGFFTHRLLRMRRGTMIHFILVAVALLTFCLLSGMAPSVLRAVIMFLTLEVGWYFNSKNKFNTLMFSAFVLLVFVPSNLFDIGFGLSYLAMIGIALLCSPLLMFADPKRKKSFAFWSIVAVSVSAQAFTFPLVLYVFGEVSLVGIVSSLIVWVTAPMIIGLTLLYVILPISPLGWLAAEVSWVQNWIMEFLGGASWSVVKAGDFSVADCALYYIVLLLLSLLINVLYRVFGPRKYLMSQYHPIPWVHSDDDD